MNEKWKWSGKSHLLFLLLYLLLLNLHLNVFLLNGLGNLVATQFVPHLLEGGIFLKLVPIIRPFHLVLVLSVCQHASPIFVFQVVLDFVDVLVGLVQHFDGLGRTKGTSLLSWAISTSPSFSFTSFSLTSPCSTMFSRFFFAWSRGMRIFLFFDF